MHRFKSVLKRLGLVSDQKGIMSLVAEIAVIAVVLALGIGNLRGDQQPGDPVLRAQTVVAQSLTLSSPDGRTSAAIRSSREINISMTFRDSQIGSVLSLGLTRARSPIIAMTGSRRDPRMILSVHSSDGSPAIRFDSSVGKTGLDFSLIEGRIPVLSLSDDAGHTRINLARRQDGTASFALADWKADPRIMFSCPQDSGLLSLFDEQTRVRAVCGISHGEGPTLNLTDSMRAPVLQMKFDRNPEIRLLDVVERRARILK